MGRRGDVVARGQYVRGGGKMPFTFKLSQRLARMRRQVALAPAAALAAGPRGVGLAQPAHVGTLLGLPDSIALAPSQHRPFSAPLPRPPPPAPHPAAPSHP